MTARLALLACSSLLLGGLARGQAPAPATPAATAAPAAPSTPISAVVVYGDRAQITRSQTVDCASGAAQFPGLPSTLETRSLWATLASGGGGVVGVTWREEVTGPRARAEELQRQIRALDDQAVARTAEIETAAALEQKLYSMRQHLATVWGRQATGAKPPVASWDAAVDLLRQQALAARTKARQAAAKHRELQRQRAILVDDLQQLEQERRRTTLRATVHLRCTGRQSVQLSYVVPNATWRIAYQVRTEPASGKATLVAQAVVQQGTGEEWRDASLSVSTANLQRQNTPPELARMGVSTQKPVDTRKILTRRFEQREHLDAGGGAEYKSAADKDAGKQSGERAAEPGLAMLLTAAGKVTVPSDGREVVVTLERRGVAASYELETVPKLFPFVYRRVALRNPFGFTMLAGPIELFRGRAFVGRAESKVRAPGEPFSLSLGVTGQVMVSRYVKREQLEGAGTFGSKKRLHHRYVIEVGNWSKQTQKIRVLENLPVSQARDIDVQLTDDATRPKQWNKTDGILTWQLTLAPRQKQSIVVAFTVTLADAYEVSGY